MAHMWRPKEIHRSQFSASTIQVPEIELRISDLAVGLFAY